MILGGAVLLEYFRPLKVAPGDGKDVVVEVNELIIDPDNKDAPGELNRYQRIDEGYGR